MPQESPPRPSLQANPLLSSVCTLKTSSERRHVLLKRSSHHSVYHIQQNRLCSNDDGWQKPPLNVNARPGSASCGKSAGGARKPWPPNGTGPTSVAWSAVNATPPSSSSPIWPKRWVFHPQTSLSVNLGRPCPQPPSSPRTTCPRPMAPTRCLPACRSRSARAIESASSGPTGPANPRCSRCWVNWKHPTRAI